MSSIKIVLRRNISPKYWNLLAKGKGFFLNPMKNIHEFYLIKTVHKRHQKALKIVRNKEVIKVAFFLIHDSVWKYDSLYNLMLKSPRFEPTIFVCPVVNYGVENMIFHMEKSYNCFKNKGYNVVKTFVKEKGTYIDVKKDFSPDLIFYTNPYEGLQDRRYYVKHFSDTLTCYVPYAVMTTKYEFFYNSIFHDLVWKNFSETSIHKEIGSKNQKNNGKNIVVTGYPGFDQLLENKTPNKDVWRNKDHNLKKIIWAPHHLMDELNKVSNFLEYYDIFLEIASNYNHKLQIAFKPHPLLRIKLENDPNWGKEKTDLYYDKWNNLENRQFENAEYADLFLTSDAMIHDCGSFMSEYLITGKPSLFMIRDESVMNQWSEFGEKAVSAHYQSRNKIQLIEFIENVVLNDNDWMKIERDYFVKNILIPKDNLSASENILSHIESQLLSGK
jgi:CDP-glycerol glycerophosphotransferase (TagB/SpsB family)